MRARFAPALAALAALASLSPHPVRAVAAFADGAALRDAVANCLAASDGTGASCCSSLGADCGAAGSSDMPAWNVSTVANMSSLFEDATAFDADISGWDTSSVVTMRRMFKNASSFAADVRGWNTAAVTDREEMFAGAAAWLALFDPAPSFVSHLGVAYPDLPLDAKEETSVLLEARLDAPAVVYFLAVPGAAGYDVLVDAQTGARRAVPTPEEIRQGTSGPAGTFGHEGLVSGSLEVPSANETRAVNVTGLTDTAANDLWVVASTGNGTLQASVTLLDAHTRDRTAAAFLNVTRDGAEVRTPTVFVGPHSVDVAAATAEVGVAFCVAQAPETQTPTAAQVRARALAGEKFTSVANITEPGALTGCAVTGLSEATRYAAFYTVEDAPVVGTPNLVEPARRFDFETGDATPPVGAATLANVSRDGFTLRLDATKNGTAHFVVLDAGTTPRPTSAEVVAGVGAGRTRPVKRGAVALAGSSATVRGAASASLAVGASAGTANVTGLRSETAYDVHVAFADAETPHRNVAGTVTTLERITTLDAIAPKLLAWFSANVTARAFEVTARASEPGRVWYVVVPHDAPSKLADPGWDDLEDASGARRWAEAPTPEEIRRGVGRGRRRAAACGVADLVADSSDSSDSSVVFTVASVADPGADSGCVDGGFYDATNGAWLVDPVAGGEYAASDELEAAGRSVLEDSADESADESSTANASSALPDWPSGSYDDLMCRRCVHLSPEGAYDVWLVAEDDGNDASSNASAGGNGTLSAIDAATRNAERFATRVVRADDAYGVPRDRSGPSVAMADASAPVVLNASLVAVDAVTLELNVTLNERGFVAFALRETGENATARLSGDVATLAGVFDEVVARDVSDAASRDKRDAALAERIRGTAPGAAVGVLLVPRANATATHRVDVFAAGYRGGVGAASRAFAADVAAFDAEPTRGSSRTRVNVGAAREVLATGTFAEDAGVSLVGCPTRWGECEVEQA